MKDSGLLFGFISVFGLVSLAVFFVILYWSNSFFSEPFYVLGFGLMLAFFIINGLISIAGICGVGRRYLRDNQRFVPASLFVQSFLTFILLYLALIFPFTHQYL
jgi:hypothetical protein